MSLNRALTEPISKYITSQFTYLNTFALYISEYIIIALFEGESEGESEKTDANIIENQT